MGSVALVGATASAAVWASGALRTSRLATVARLATVVLGLVAVVALAHDLVTIDPASRYVDRFSSERTPLPYRLAGLWGGMEGSMLTWSVVVAGCFAVARSRDATRSRWLDGLGGVLAAAFFAVTALWASPFDRLAVPTGRGAGLPAVLQHPAMLYHPPTLYAGLALTMVPMARSIAALVDRRLDERWRAGVVTWARSAWFVLALGMVLGSNWAYAELGWGGFWAWDPVENAGLVPWLLLTAAIHAALAAPRHPAADRTVAALAIGAGVATIFGVYVTRSGGTGSIHAFASSSTIGRALLVLAVGAGALGVWALTRTGPTHVRHDREHATRAEELPRPGPMHPSYGREGVLLVQVVTLTSIALIVAAGTFGPIIGELFGRRPGVVRPGAYATVLLVPALVTLLGAAVGPSLRRNGGRRVGALLIGATIGGCVAVLALVTLDPGRSVTASVVLVAAIVAAVTAAAPVVAAGTARPGDADHAPTAPEHTTPEHTTPEHTTPPDADHAPTTPEHTTPEHTTPPDEIDAARRRFGRTTRRGGIALSHAGFAVLLAGAAGTALGTDTSLMVPVGGTARGPDATVTLHALEPDTTARYEMVRADVTVGGNDHHFAPELRAYDDQPLPTAEAAFDHRLLGDTIVVMSVLDDDLAAARITVRDRPLINLVWWGAATTLVGAAVAWVAHPRRGGADRSRRAAARAGSGAGRSRSATPPPRTTATTAADATSSAR